MTTHYRTKPTRFSWTFIAIGLLVIANLFTIGELLRVRGVKLSAVQSQLERSQTRLGTTMAEADFERGELRVYEPAPMSAGPATVDTGMRDGSFEVWSWPYAELAGSEAAAQAFAEAYNQKMRELHEATELAE
ncbi:MAG: hypothetical protein AAF823_03210 [Planctomycetota bacterium]